VITTRRQRAKTGGILHRRILQPRQSVLNIRREIILFRLSWEFDCTHINDQHIKLKMIKYFVPCWSLFVNSYAEGSKSNIACCAPRNICVGFADVTRVSGVNLAHMSRMLRAKFAYDMRHVARVHHANVARTCARTQQNMLLLDPSVSTLGLITVDNHVILASGAGLVS
jgi:hypothetical protein